MMLETIRNKLAALDCDGWELTEVAKRGWEFYFIRHALDQHRAADVRTYQVKVFKALEGGKYLGSAVGEIAPTASEAEIDAALAGLLFQAGLVKNPYYTLNDAPVDLPAGKNVDVEAIAEDFLRAFDGVRETEGEFINSYEIFVSALTVRFENSRGVRVTATYPSSTVDLVVNARKDGREIELYRFYTSGSCDGEKLRRDVEQVLTFGRDRLGAVPTPKLRKSDVVFSTDDALEIYRFLAARTNAMAKVRRISDWEPGKEICPWTSGDRLSLELLSSLPNSSRDLPVDEEGAPIRDRFLIKDGVMQGCWGNRQFSQYLGLEESSGMNNARVTGGTAAPEEIRSGDFLEVVEFSDFQVDQMAGNIAGEIRLAYWHHGGEVTAVTGGSVTGSLPEALPTLRCTKELTQYDRFVIPAVTRLAGLNITGVAEM